MRKKNSLAFFTLFVAGLFSLSTLNILAQKEATDRIRQSQKANLENRVLQHYIDISSLPKDERKKNFSNVSAEEKANLFKLHLALQFVKRPDLTKEQKDLILEGISIITPDVYGRENPEKLEKSRQDGILLDQKARVLFSKQEVIEIFADLGGGTTEISLLQKYLDISALSVPERKDTLQNVSAEEKSSLWRVHLPLHFVKQPRLNNRQMEIILEAITFITPELYKIPIDSSEWKVKVDEPVKLFTRRALEVFSKKEISEIFSNLGGRKSSSKDNIALEVGWCDCARESDTCVWWCGGSACGVPPCTGCGVLDLFVCNGTCQIGEEQ